MSKKNDNDLVLDHYYKGRANHFLNNLLIPLIKDAVAKPATDDVAGCSGIQYAVNAVRGAEQQDAAAARSSKFNLN